MTDEQRLWDLCEEFASKTKGVTSSFLCKRLSQNGISDFPKFMRCTIDDFLKFNNIGNDKANIFVSMQEYWNNK